jgi:hypothetical protein
MSTLRRAGRNIKRTATLPNQSMVYDYVLRCAVRACLEQTQNQRKETKKENRHSSHLSNVGEVLGNFTNQFSEETRPDKISKPLVTGLSTRLDDIKLGKDLSKSEYGDKRFLAVVKQMRDHLKQYKSHPDETINDLVIFFLRAGEAELKKEDPNPAVWFKNLDRFVARFAELVLITVQEDVPASATPEVIESLNRFVSPNKAAKKEQRSSQPTDNVLDTLENFPMIQTVKELFKIPIKEHRDKLRELQNICTEAVRYIKKIILFIYRFQLIL